MTAQGVLSIQKALFSHWGRHRLQLATLLLGLALATALWTGVQALNTHARASYDDASNSLTSSQRTTIGAKDGAPFDQAVFAALRRRGLAVVPIVMGPLDGTASPVVLGLDPLSFDASAEADGFAPPSGDTMLAFLEQPGSLHVAPTATADLAAHLEALPADMRPRIVPDGSVPNGTAIGDISTVQRLLGLKGKLTSLRLPNGTKAADVVLPAPWDKVLIVSDPVADVDMTGLTDSFHLNLTAFGLLSFVVGLFIVYGAVGLALESRLSTVRTLRVCGVSRAQVMASLTAETILMALLAGSAGVGLGFLIAKALLPDVASSLRGLYGAEVGSDLSPGLLWWLGGIGISMLGALAATAGAFIKVYRLPTLSQPGHTAWRAGQRKTLIFQRLAGLLLWGMAALLAAYGAGLLMAFIALAGVLVGSALLLPSLLAVLLDMGTALSRQPIPRWFWADSHKQLTGLSLALMALLLALSANIGVGGMVEGFRNTFVKFLDERLATEVYIYAPDAETASALREWLPQQSEVTGVLPQWHAVDRFEGMPLDVTGVNDHATFRSTWTLLSETPTAWDDVFAGRSLLINEQMANRYGLKAGESLSIQSPAGEFSAEIAGIYADYGNPRNAIRVSIPVIDAFWPSAERRRIGARTEGDPTDLITRIKAHFNLSETQVIDQTSLKTYSQSVFEKTFAVTAALNVLTLGVAAVAMVTSLLTLSTARIADMAPVWAIGVARRTLVRIELAKTLMLALLTCLVAIPVGLAVCWCLVNLVNVEAFGWRLPFHFFPGQWVELMALGVITALLAALYPAWRLAKTPPAHLTKVFANER